ncbi:MAG: D-glycero-beta-D-manno-heptose 1-phosphate adenylyltransferase [Phycisphaerae bacterium]
MYEKLLKIVTNLGSPRVLLVGDFMLDAYIYGDALRISPEAPVPVLKVQNTEYSCGGAGSVARNLTALGASVICVGVIGKDTEGQMLKNMLTESGADISHLIETSDRPTTTKNRLVGLAQHRHRQQLIRIDKESSEELSKQLIEQILETVKENISGCDAVCLQDYGKAVLSEETCRNIIKLAKKAEKCVLVDPALIKDYSKYTGATLITPNRKEAGTATGYELTDDEAVSQAAKKLMQKFKLDGVVITLDKQGAYLQTKTTGEIVPTRPRNVYDVTGAGDMVLATLAIALAAGCDFNTSVQLSNITGGLEVEKFGAVPVTIEEVINEIVAENRGKGGKIRPLDSLLTELQWHKRQKESVVFTNGCFDVIHRGHIEFLRFCKAQGDVLVLGLNSDDSVKSIKGPERPINNQHDRAAVLAAMESVDYIVIFDEPDPMKLIEQIKPNVLVKGKDWQDKGVVGREFVESNGGKVVLAPLVDGKSSTATIEKMKALDNQ